MGADTVAELKAQLCSLMDKRSAIEREISARTARLEAAGVGMSASLVDAEVRQPFVRRRETTPYPCACC